jgi:phosphonate transport system substrate-binding protein
MHIFHLFFIFWLSVLSQTLHAQSVQNTAKKLTVGVVPQFSASEIARNWLPFLTELSAASDTVLELKAFPSIPQFEKAFLAGETDLVFMNPYHAVMAHKAQGYVPLVRGSQMLQGILVVNRASKINKIQQLANESVAFPSPNAFGASLYMRALLQTEGVPVAPVYVSTHSNAYRQVATGQVVAAGGIRSTFERESPELRNQLRVMFETPPAAAHPLAAHPRVKAPTQQALAQAIIHMQQTEVGQALLKGVGLAQPVAAQYKQDYAPLERYGLERFVVLESNQP